MQPDNQELEALAQRGLAALLAGEPEAARRDLGAVHSTTPLPANRGTCKHCCSEVTCWWVKVKQPTPCIATTAP